MINDTGWPKLEFEIEKTEIKAISHKMKFPEPKVPREVLKAKDYYSHHRVEYDKPNVIGFLSLDVLPYLIGHKWDEVALGYVHSLRPSCIRVGDGMFTCDGILHRVSITVDENEVITRLTQEVEVGLPKGIYSGKQMRNALKYGAESPQVLWYNDAEEFRYTSEGYFKRVGEKYVIFPQP